LPPHRRAQSLNCAAFVRSPTRSLSLLVRARGYCYGQRVYRIRGLTAIELMSFLGSVALLVAIAMVCMARYVRHGRTAEAEGSVVRLAASSATFFNRSDAMQPLGASAIAAHSMRHFPTSSKTPVPEDPVFVRGSRYQSQPSAWAVSPWRELEFSITQPQSYQYAFEAQGSGASARALVVAEGDLDGDGDRSRFSLAITANQELDAVVDKEMVRKDADE
jgi:hypothetical protein